MTLDSYKIYKNELEGIKKNDSYRILKKIQNRAGIFASYGGRDLLNLSSNDYLGFATNAALHEEFYAGCHKKNIINDSGLGSSSSRLITGDHYLNSELEQEIVGLYSRNIRPDAANEARIAALLFSSGYHANIGILPVLAEEGDIIFSDKQNHASIIDGIRLSKAECTVYEHLDYELLVSQLSEKRDSYRNAIIVSESVFSMDGDMADLKKLVDIKNRFNALLYIDEAHALGVFGHTGLGICERDGVIGDIDVIVATFGKALGSIGAYAVTRPLVKEMLINKARSFIFTTALPPVIINWNLFALRKIPTRITEREHIMHISGQLRTTLAGHSLVTGGRSQIVPVIFGDNDRAMRAAAALLNRGYLVFPIRPPSVPKGGSRLRISIRADIGWEDLKSIPEILQSSA
jgi:8-amino-7-oxononanoate synthase